MAVNILDPFLLCPPFSLTSGVSPPSVGGHVNMRLSLGGSTGERIGALYVGNDTFIRITGASVKGTYINSATVRFSLYAEDDETVLAGPTSMTAAGSGGDYEGVLESSVTDALLTSGDLVVGERYRLGVTLVSGPYNGQADRWFPFLYRRASI